MNTGQYDMRAAAQASQGLVGYAEKPKIGLVEGIDSELSVAVKQIHELHAQVKTIGDRLFGTQPEAVRGAKAASETLMSCQAGRLEATVGYIRESLKDLADQIMRFDRL